MKKNNYTTFYIVRHGETEWNVQRRLQGQQNSHLTENGLQQATKLGEKLKHIHFDEAFSSDLIRAQKTAELLTLERQLEVKTTQLLRERSYGKWEGKPYTIYETELKELVQQWEQLPHEEKKSFKYPDIETDAELIRRFILFLRETAIAYPGKTILVVSHGGMMKALLLHLGFTTYDQSIFVKNTSYFQLQSDGIDFFIKETYGIVVKEEQD